MRQGKLFFVAIVAVSLAGAFSAQAVRADDEAPAAVDPRGIYIGAAVGAADWNKIDDITFDWKAQIWWRLHDYFALELDWVDLNDVSATIAPKSSGTGGGSAAGVSVATGSPVRFGINGFDISAVPILPLGHDLAVFGKVGVFLWDADFRGSAGDGDHDLSFGAGLMWDVAYGWGIRAEWERFQLGFSDLSEDVDSYTLGGYYHF